MFASSVHGRMRVHARRRAVLGLTVLVLGGTLCSAVDARAADDLAASRAWVVQQYVKQYGVSQARAGRVLAEQARGANLGAELQQRLGADALGVRFDQANARWVVAITQHADRATVDRVLQARGLATPLVETKAWTAADRRATLTRMQTGLKPLIADGIADISDHGDGLEVTLRGATADQLQASQRLAAPGAVDVTIKRDAQVPLIAPQACNNMWCDAPVRGGERWILEDPGHAGAACTLGFSVDSPVSSLNYVATAGHCVTPGTTNYGGKCSTTVCDPAFAHQHSAYFSSGGDGGLLELPNTTMWPLTASWWNAGCCDALPVTGQGVPSIGSYICHTGQADNAPGSGYTLTSCGNVDSQSITALYASGPQPQGMIRVRGACDQPGNSGGPWIDAYIGTAIGVHSGGTTVSQYVPDCSATSEAYIEPIARVLSNLGVTLLTR
jgi:hypothetical protein